MIVVKVSTADNSRDPWSGRVGHKQYGVEGEDDAALRRGLAATYGLNCFVCPTWRQCHGGIAQRQALRCLCETVGGRAQMTVMRAGELALGWAGAGFNGVCRCPWGPSTDEQGRALGLVSGVTVSSAYPGSCSVLFCSYFVLFRFRRQACWA